MASLMGPRAKPPVSVSWPSLSLVYIPAVYHLTPPGLMPVADTACNKQRSTMFAPPFLQVAADLYRDMFLGREFEEMCAQMYYRGKMFGFVHLYSGQEAVSTGVIRHLRQDDYICSTYRDHVHALSKNVPPRCETALLAPANHQPPHARICRCAWLLAAPCMQRSATGRAPSPWSCMHAACCRVVCMHAGPHTPGPAVRREIMAELFGKKTGICRGQGGSMHMFSKKHNLVRPVYLPRCAACTVPRASLGMPQREHLPC